MPIVFRLTIAILRYRKMRTALSALAVGVAFFLATAQFGLLVGWIHTNTALIWHAGADLWIMAEQTPAWDYGTAIPRQRIYQARSVPGVVWAEGLFMAWNIWQRPDGRRVNIELVGLDRGNRGGPWQMQDGAIGSVHRKQTVVVDELFRKSLGVDEEGGVFEISGEKAEVGGISRGVRTFTASPHVFTSIEQAVRYDKRYQDDEVTYVMAKAAPGVDLQALKREMSRRVKGVEVLTSDEFRWRSANYWMLETGVGITVVITAILGLVVAGLITSQTLFSMTQENLHHYATLLAVGFRRETLLAVVLCNGLAIGIGGVVLGSGFFFPASWVSARTPIPLEMTPWVFAALVAAGRAASVLASLFSLRATLGLDPATVFRQ